MALYWSLRVGPLPKRFTKRCVISHWSTGTESSGRSAGFVAPPGLRCFGAGRAWLVVFAGTTVLRESQPPTGRQMRRRVSPLAFVASATAWTICLLLSTQTSAVSVSMPARTMVPFLPLTWYGPPACGDSAMLPHARGVVLSAPGGSPCPLDVRRRGFLKK